MECAFAFAEYETARTWQRQSTLPEHVYAVQPGPSAHQHLADMSFVDLANDQHSFENVVALARRYWAGEVQNQALVEALVAGPLTIVNRMSEQ